MMLLKLSYFYCVLVILTTAYSCNPNKEESPIKSLESNLVVVLDNAQANRLIQLPLSCIQNPLPYKSGLVIAQESDLQMPQVHHPAFYGCFDWHSAVHGHWSLVYLLKNFNNLQDKDRAMKMLKENLTSDNIEKEIEYFSLNKNTKSFERTYGWAWLLKLQEELFTWENTEAKTIYNNINPLAEYISKAYQEYLPKLVYPIRVGEHSNTAFGLSFAYDYALAVDDSDLKESIEINAKRFYFSDAGCPISWEPSGYDFLSPCLQEMDIMRKVLNEKEFNKWSVLFLPSLFDKSLQLDPGKIKDRSDGKLVHLDGLNFSRAWCLYSIENPYADQLADIHLDYSLTKITDGDYAGQHWLASFALYAFKCQKD